MGRQGKHKCVAIFSSLQRISQGLLNVKVSIAKMALSTLWSATYCLYARLDVRFEVPLNKPPVVLTLRFHACLGFSKELLDWISSWSIRRYEIRYYTGIRTYLSNLIRVVESNIIHNKDGLRLRPFAAVTQQLFDEVFEKRLIHRSSEESA